MMTRSWIWIGAALLVFAAGRALPGVARAADGGRQADEQRARWNEPIAPFRIVGDTWYVGPRGLTVLAVRTSAGVALIDAALPESAAQIIDNLAALGVAPRDVRLLLSSYAHFDHAGGLAALRARTGAELVATRDSAALLARGGLGDLHFGDALPYPPVDVDRVIADGAVLRLGQHEFVALLTPGHTRGGTTWTWREKHAGDAYAVVYADSLTAPGYRLVGNERYPGIVADLLGSADRIAALPCDVLITPHPQAAGLFDRRAARAAAEAPLTGAADCVAYARHARATIERTVAAQAVSDADDDAAASTVPVR